MFFSAFAACIHKLYKCASIIPKSLAVKFLPAESYWKMLYDNTLND